jgi:hypothetical protein
MEHGALAARESVDLAQEAVKRAIRELETVDETTTYIEDAHAALRLAMQKLEQAAATLERGDLS